MHLRPECPLPRKGLLPTKGENLLPFLGLPLLAWDRVDLLGPGALPALGDLDLEVAGLENDLFEQVLAGP